MKEDDLEKLNHNEVVVFTKINSFTNAFHPYKKGDELIFERFDYTIDTFYFGRLDENQTQNGYKLYTLCNFTSEIHKFIELKSDYIKIIRNNKINKILPCRKKKLNG